MMKKYLSGLTIVLLLSILVGCSQEKMKLKKDKFIVEYGNSISMNTSDYLENQEDFLKDVKIEIEGNKEEGKSYYPIGEYKIVLTHKDDTCHAIIEIKDTVSPEFIDLNDSYEVEFGSKFDVNKLKTKDLSKVSLSIDDSQINYKKSGTYSTKVTAKDESGNETKKDIKIIVKKEVKNNTESSTHGSSPTQNNNASSKGSSTNKSSNNSSSSKNPDSSKKDQELDTDRDENSYIDFDNGSAWGGSFELPDDNSE